MRPYDAIACTLVIAVGIAWFVAAEVVYDGSLMEDPFWRSGMFALYYVPLATIYLLKATRGECRGISIIAWLLAFLVLSAMMTADILVTHYKPNCDYCCIPVDEDFMMQIPGALVFTGLFSASDVVALRLLRKVKHPFARQWLLRRTMRVLGAIMLTCLSWVLLSGVLLMVGRLVRQFQAP